MSINGDGQKTRSTLLKSIFNFIEAVLRDYYYKGEDQLIFSKVMVER